jgi:uncharacterized protein (TIGR02145 family)
MKIYSTLFFYCFAHYFLCQNSEISDNHYNTVTIGNQTWMTDNLNVSQFQNGDIIPEAKTTEEWNKATKKGKPVWCYCNNNPIYGKKYGRLYNWYAVNDPRGLAPSGFHVPSSTEWNDMIEFLGGPISCANQIKSREGWVDGAADLRPDGKALDYNGNNESGFSAYPAGYRNNNGVHLAPGTSYAYWWTSTEDTKNSAWFVTFNSMQATRSFDSKIVYFDEISIERSFQFNKDMGYSVRCIKD